MEWVSNWSCWCLLVLQHVQCISEVHWIVSDVSLTFKRKTFKTFFCFCMIAHESDLSLLKTSMIFISMFKCSCRSVWEDENFESFSVQHLIHNLFTILLSTSLSLFVLFTNPLWRHHKCHGGKDCRGLFYVGW